MSERRCEGCRWFARYNSQQLGECRRYPPQHPHAQRGWLMVNETEFCGEWADADVTAKEAERLETVRQFALAIVASDTAGDLMVHRVWQQAAELARYEGQT